MPPERWEQIDRLLHAALDRSASQRDAFLDESCAGDSLLRREVESLLKAHQQAGSFLDGGAVAAAARTLTRTCRRVGETVGPYHLLGLLGAGGMGEVYRAHDARLGRDVAIKFLPPAFASDQERLHRFEQEARLTGMLNHPNILAIYDLGTHQTSPYIVSEVLEGEDLRAHLRKGRLPGRKAMEYVRQIASGLAAAHARGITHRDLKPENVFVTPDGRVKILDFGLAKLNSQPLGDLTRDQGPAERLETPSGVLVGTTAYMSPEQISGEAADARSDIFALGAILYEMVSGRRAFQGDSSIEIMNAILKAEPPEWSEYPGDAIPPQLERIVRRCLEKRPEQRFQSASDLGFALETLATPWATPLPATPPLAARARRSSLKWASWVPAGILALALTALAVLYWERGPVAAPPMHLLITLPENLTHVLDPVISPDGRLIAFVGGGAEGKYHLWIHSLESAVAQPVLGTEDARRPFWSPDSRSIGFFKPGSLNKIDVSGGPPRLLCEASTSPAVSAAWSKAGRIVFSADPRSLLFEVSANAGKARPISTFDTSRAETRHHWPSFLPDQRHFVYIAESPRESALFLGALDSSERELLLAGVSRAVVAPPNHVLFVRDGSLLAGQVDVKQRKLVSGPVGIARNILSRSPADVAISTSETGVLAYHNESGLGRLVWYDRKGAQLGTLDQQLTDHRLSPDGKRLAGSRMDPETGRSDIWSVDLARRVPLRVTTDPRTERSPVWSPDGNIIVFDRQGPRSIFQKLADGSGDEKDLLADQNDFTRVTIVEDWSADGRFILFRSSTPETGRDIWAVPLFGDHRPFVVLRQQYDERWGRLSPDVRWLAYTSNETGDSEVYVQPFPAGGRKLRISADGGSHPKWRRDGRELFYLSADQKIMSVEIRSNAGELVVGAPRSLFPVRVTVHYTNNAFEVAPDGQRFLVAAAADHVAPIHVILNWTEALKRSVEFGGR